jgi:hypothetical protein
MIENMLGQAVFVEDGADYDSFNHRSFNNTQPRFFRDESVSQVMMRRLKS